MGDPRTELVGRGYDVIGERFTEWRDRIVGDPRRAWEEELASRLQDGARVLELGCGSGVPDTQRLALRFQVTGVDISAEQVRRARDAVPEADFIQSDFTALELEPASFDAVVSFYAFNHVPRELLAPTFARIHRWLVPHGLLMTALGVGDMEAWTGDWLGAPTFFSSFPRETNTRLVREAGFEILRDELVTFREPDGDATFQWVLAKRGATPTRYASVMSEISDFNQQIIEEFRANDGAVGGPLQGLPLVLLHHTGAKSGIERVNPLAYQRIDDDSVAVFASKGGAPTNPDWYHNLVANPSASIEIGTERYDVTARIAAGDERQRIWDAQKAAVSNFAEYEMKSGGREIPVVVLDKVT